MPPRVKVCGLTEPARIEQAAELGAAFVGLIFYPPSPRYVDPALARPVDAAELVGDATKARDLLGWTPTVGFEDLVARLVTAELTD